MSEDWYTKGEKLAMEHLAEETDLDEEIVKKVYAALFNFGFIDYDVEKELFYEYANEE